MASSTLPTAVENSTKPSVNSTVTAVDIENDGPLFPASLISPEVISVLPTDYTIRPLRRSDYGRGYLDVLRVLTTVGEIAEEQWNERYEWIKSRNDEYYMLVVCDGEDRVVGTGSLIVERKFIHSLGLVGHIEDIAVEQGQQGKKLGLRIIQALDHVAAQVGCYKVRCCLFSSFRLCVLHSTAVNMLSMLMISYRVFSTVPRPTRASTSSVASSEPVWRWLTTTKPVIGFFFGLSCGWRSEFSHDEVEQDLRFFKKHSQMHHGEENIKKNAYATRLLEVIFSEGVHCIDDPMEDIHCTRAEFLSLWCSGRLY